MTYRIIQPPFSLQFSRCSKPELRSYYDWFMAALPERIAELEPVVRETPAHRAWRADGTRDSVSPLGHWLWSQVETRPRSRDELDGLQCRLRYPIELSSDELTDRTFSLAVDIAMYVGMVLEANFPGARWDQRLEDTSSADYGQPVIVGMGPVPFNPVRTIVTLAYRIASKKKDVASLRELYGIWQGMRKAPSLQIARG